MFTGYRHPTGYGQVNPGRRDGGLKWTHRVAYEHAHGPIGEGRIVMHLCDNPPCCNPAHLTTGTMADNTADMMRKRRAPIGEARPDAKITIDIARRIRELHGTRPAREIAEMFGVSQTLVSMIGNRKKWAHA